MISFKKLCTYYQIATIFLLSTFSIYAIIGGHDNQHNVFPSLISQAKAQTGFDRAKIDKLKQEAHGIFTIMRFADSPYTMQNASFINEEGKQQSLKDFSGKILLVNFWAIWCPPCRKEMPELAKLKRELASDDFDVVTINVDTVADDEKLKTFLKDIQSDNLPLYRDKKMEIINILRKDGLALGLPLTVLLDENGNLLASYNGAAPWGNDDAKKLMQAAIKLKNSKTH